MNKKLIKFGYIALAIIVIFIGGNYACKRSRINNIESNLGIKIPLWTSLKGDKELNGQDYSRNYILKFSDKGISDLVSQIEKSIFYDLHHEFYGHDQVAWKMSDTVLYFKVRDSLKVKHLTGYWIKSDSSTLVFQEPDFSDVPNSAILFDEAYEVEAELFVEEKKMVYRYIKF